jgi:hypothetical protein
LLTGVGTVRQGVQEAWSQLKDVRTATEEIYETGKAHTQGKQFHFRKFNKSKQFHFRKFNKINLFFVEKKYDGNHKEE